MNYESIANELISHLGSGENILAVANCMTRIRVQVNDTNLVKMGKLAEVEGVIRVISDETLQIVVGPGKSRKIKDAMTKALGTSLKVSVENWEENKKSVRGKKSGLKEVLRKIGNIFVPLIPAIIAAGLLNGLAGYYTNLYNSQGTNLPLWIIFFTTIGGALFKAFPIFVGYRAAEEFGATPGLGAMIGGISIAPAINTLSKAVGLFNADVPLKSVLTTGKGGIIGVIFGVWILSMIEKRIRKHMPDFLDTVLTPTITILLSATLTIFIIMPVAGVLSDGIIGILETLVMTKGPLSLASGFVLSSLFLPLLALGLHHGLIPFYMIQLEQFGAISLFAILCMAGPAQMGGAVAIWLRANKNEKLRDIIQGALPVGLLGIGEPMLYGVTLPLGKPFLTACIGGGFGGMIVAMTGVATASFGPAGLSAIPLVVPGKTVFYLLGWLASFVGGTVLTYFFGVPKDINDIKI